MQVPGAFAASMGRLLEGLGQIRSLAVEAYLLRPLSAQHLGLLPLALILGQPVAYQFGQLAAARGSIGVASGPPAIRNDGTCPITNGAGRR
jgi:hypothetical protein